ncbi:hypothetical protein O0L34_g7632 [Tuta absoluta]|nr:hypothetical protein O0L34_g7632 [Tuta absoluta]
MVGREVFTFTEEQAKDVLYSGDALINEASIHALLAGPALAICLRSLDEVDVVALIRKILYEDSLIQPADSDDKKSVRLAKTAFEHYKTFSPTREQIMQKRRDERIMRIEEKKEKRARILAEMQRLAHQRREEAIEAKKNTLEQKKMELLKTGKLAELDQLKAEAEEDEDVDVEIPEELSEEEEEEEVVEDPDEYFPPPGLPIPGFYSPPNDVAKANGLAILFPGIVQEYVKPTEEFLPPHVLVMLHIHKRHKSIEHMTPFKYGILHMGIFQANTPFDAKHVAYSVKQFDSMDISIVDDLKLCFMVSTKVDVPLLELMELNPLHVSRDTTAGEDECAAMFKVDYGDTYPEFEDFDKEDDVNIT